MALPMALPTDLPTTLSMTLPTAQLMVSSIVTDANDKVSSTFTINLVTHEANIGLKLPSLPYPNISLPFHFHFILQASMLRTTHSHIITILLGSNLFFPFFDFSFLCFT